MFFLIYLNPSFFTASVNFSSQPWLERKCLKFHFAQVLGKFLVSTSFQIKTTEAFHQKKKLTAHTVPVRFDIWPINFW